MELRSDPADIGLLRDSAPLLGQPTRLQRELEEQGYLFLRALLDRELVLLARQVVTARLAAEGALEPGTEPMAAIAAANYHRGLLPEPARNNAPLRRVLYDGAMMALFECLFAGPVRHFDYTWFRAVPPGQGTPPHCDSVYMNRGTPRLLTAWTPIGDCDYDQGGLMILEGSSHHQRLRETYARMDVDSYCVNRTGRAGLDA